MDENTQNFNTQPNLIDLKTKDTNKTTIMNEDDSTNFESISFDTQDALNKISIKQVKESEEIKFENSFLQAKISQIVLIFQDSLKIVIFDDTGIVDGSISRELVERYNLAAGKNIKIKNFSVWRDNDEICVNITDNNIFN